MVAFTARAHTNIALLKYWGKVDQQLIIPTTTSISLTLDEFYTETTVEFDPALPNDQITLDQQPLKEKDRHKISIFLNLIRTQAQINTFARVQSVNHVPTAAGLASSASAFAALAGAGSAAAGLNLSQADLSRLARQGSGSASRSIFGGFVQWDRGTDHQTSVAHPLQENVDWPIQLLTVIVSDQPKKINSRGGMQNAMQNSPFYQNWVERSNGLVKPMQTAINQHDLATLGTIAEQNALEMHAQNMVANPPFFYLTDISWQIINLVQDLRQSGLQVYATMDAGPNVKIISHPDDTPTIKSALFKILPEISIQVATPGPGLTVWQNGAAHA
ncbi:diphosphomevalonate decarboxylase [Weissella coleopterorum]|uniref:diphosphomevalonate decarboxylase n=1 Tax=Weissella coleopterorum TaxID=2714949 RepID=A0A6G8B0U6_9LACO|nr:diphosphomevalonate decarboxylase [Weissella coleopterorum]QIL50842.1 diphosphomevalonate decarboxylase [Weissella coleopterorum]